MSAFDAIAGEYDRVRPTYPPELVDRALAGLPPGARVVEVGCGTGQLTAALAERGLSIDAVDPGPSLVELARRRAPEARFHLARFEDVELPARAHDAVLSADAFHWVDPAIGWEKAAALLRPGGRLALLGHVGGFDDEVDAEILAAWREVLPEAAGWVLRDEATLWSGAEERRGNVSELWSWLTNFGLGRPEAAALFGGAELAPVPIEVEPTAEQLLALLRTTSSYLRLDPPRQARLDDRIRELLAARTGTFRSRAHAVLVTAAARARPPGA